MGGAEAGTDGCVDGAPVAGGVGMFAREEEGAVGGQSHFGAGIERTGRDQAVGTEGERAVAASWPWGEAADE